MIATAEISEPIDRAQSGVVFDIKRFATGDGPGIRTLVFLKGCPLRCAWCANPESQVSRSEIMFTSTRCVGCGRCVEACPSSAIRIDETYGLVTDPDACTGCGRCVAACRRDARELLGETMSFDALMRIIRRDRRYYDNSGGGVTITGGEPLAQCLFTRALLKACHEESIHTAIETCGFAPWECLESVLPYLDLLFYDIKHHDEDRHREWTGQSNTSILSNLARVSKAFDHGDLVIRIPCIPGVNDDKRTLASIFRMLVDLHNVLHVELMPYHRLGTTKYVGLGRAYTLSGLAAAQMKDLENAKALGCSLGLNVRIDSA